MATYPSTPGFKVRGFPDPSPSQDAAIAMAGRAPTLRSWIVRRMSHTGGTWTPDEMARELSVTPLSTRPRFTELRNMGRIERTGERRPSSNGHTQWVYRLVTNQEDA
jgi:predicted ArsR family transcriptional regulator